MRGTHIVPSLRAQQLTGRSTHRNRVAGRPDALEGDVPVLVGEELAAQVHVGLHGVLVFVKALSRRLPDIDLRADDRRAAAITEPGVDEQRRPRRRGANDRTAVGCYRRLLAPEWTEKTCICVGLAIAVVEETDKRRQSERTR